MTFKYTNRHGFLLGFIDFFTAGLFFLLYMPLGGLQDELEYILNRKMMPYWKAYLLGIPTLFFYPLVRMARIAEELKAKALEMGVQAHTRPGGICLGETPLASCCLDRLSPRTGFSAH